MGAMISCLKFFQKFYVCIDYYIYKKRIDNYIANGMKIGRNVNIMPRAVIDSNYPYLISIGDNCSISNEARLMAHDATMFMFLGHTRLGKIDIRENCFIGEKAIILPGVTIGPNVLVAAGSVVNKDIPPNSCVAGVPARVYAKFDDYLESQKAKISSSPKVNSSDVAISSIKPEMKDKVIELAEKGVLYTTNYRGKFPYRVS